MSQPDVASRAKTTAHQAQIKKTFTYHIKNMPPLRGILISKFIKTSFNNYRPNYYFSITQIPLIHIQINEMTRFLDSLFIFKQPTKD